IPLAIGLLGPDGAQLAVRIDGGAGRSAAGDATAVLELSEPAYTVRLLDVPPGAIPSLLRNFSAPVIVEYPYHDVELAVLARHDPDPCNRWDALQQSLLGHLSSAVDAL